MDGDDVGGVEASQRSGRRAWETEYERLLQLCDGLVIALTVYLTQRFWLGAGNPEAGVSVLGSVPYWAISLVIVVAWWLALQAVDSRSYRVIGSGLEEYQRVARATFAVFGLVAIVALIAKLQIARGYVLIALPVGLLVLLAERWLCRQWLVHQRRAGRMNHHVVIVGTRERIKRMMSEIARSRDSGFKVVGAATYGHSASTADDELGLPLCDADHAVEFMRSLGADTIAVSGGDAQSGTTIKQLGWELESGKEHLIVSPGLVDVAGPRLTMRPVAGLSLIHVQGARMNPGSAAAKRAADIVGAALLLIALLPVLVIIGLAVKVTSPGPVFFAHERIGKGGAPFKMLKFRSMRQGADGELKKLLEAQGTQEVPLFKVKNDPRITPVGGFLRKYSLDELPQLINVLRGDMSLVGPRPQVAGEVALYDQSAYRRLIVKPGITGLWQVSGRSDLAWEDAIRLDLSYVENWSPFVDGIILLKTMKAVILKTGAY